MALLQALVPAALVLLRADALASEAALPGLIVVGANLALLAVPAAGSDLLLLAAVAADGLDLAAVVAGAEVAQPVTSVLATPELAVADLITDRRERRVVGARGGALNGERRAVGRAADDKRDLAWRAWPRVAVERARVGAIRADARAGVVARVRRGRCCWGIGKSATETSVAANLVCPVLLASGTPPRRFVLALGRADPLGVVVQAARGPVADARDVEGRVAGCVVGRGIRRAPVLLQVFGILWSGVGRETRPGLLLGEDGVEALGLALNMKEGCTTYNRAFHEGLAAQSTSQPRVEIVRLRPARLVVDLLALLFLGRGFTGSELCAALECRAAARDGLGRRSALRLQLWLSLPIVSGLRRARVGAAWSTLVGVRGEDGRAWVKRRVGAATRGASLAILHNAPLCARRFATALVVALVGAILARGVVPALAAVPAAVRIRVGLDGQGAELGGRRLSRAVLRLAL